MVAPRTPSTKRRCRPEPKLPSSSFRRRRTRSCRCPSSAGRPVVLVFYPEDWSPVCSDQLALYQELLPEFERFDAQLVGISVDGIWCHLAFAKDRHLNFPLLADFEPKGEVSRRYGVYRNGDGTSERALFVIDRDGIIRWSYVSPVGSIPAPTESCARWKISACERTDVGSSTHAAGQPTIATTSRARRTRRDARRVRRLRVSLLRGRVSDRQGGAGARWETRLRFVFRNFPIATRIRTPSKRPRPRRLPPRKAGSGRCTISCTRTSSGSSDDDLLGYAEQLGLDADAFERELAGHVYAARVHEDFMSGVRSGVNGTPTFYVNGVRHDDSYDFETLLGALQQAAA